MKDLLWLLLILLLMSVCCTPDPDPVCADSLQKEHEIEATLAEVRSDLFELKLLAKTVAEHSPIRGPETRACPPMLAADQNAQVTEALKRAAQAERDLEALRSRVDEAKEAWHNPSTTYLEAEEMMEAL